MRSNLHLSFMRLTLLACCLLFAGATISTSISAAEEPAQTKAKKGKKGPDSAVDERFLSVNALADLFPDTQISHVNPNSAADVIMFFHADGRLSGSSTQTRGSRFGTTAPVEGNWFVSPLGRLCFTSDQQGQLCFYLARRGSLQLIRYSIRKEPMPGIDWTIVKPGPRAHLVLGE